MGYATNASSRPSGWQRVKMEEPSLCPNYRSDVTKKQVSNLAYILGRFFHARLLYSGYRQVKGQA
jgi:hypothetical protein